MYILLSIHTKYANKIIEGTKKYEFRGWKISDRIKYVYIYSSGIEKKVVAKFEISKVHNNSPKEIWNQFKDYSGIRKEEYDTYVSSFNYDIIYAIEIKNLQVYKRPLSLRELDENLLPPQRFKYLEDYQVKLLEREMI